MVSLVEAISVMREGNVVADEDGIQYRIATKGGEVLIPGIIVREPAEQIQSRKDETKAWSPCRTTFHEMMSKEFYLWFPKTRKPYEYWDMTTEGMADLCNYVVGLMFLNKTTWPDPTAKE